MKRILIVLLLLFTFPVMASHIVGGEFELIHLSGNKYRISLIYYFDVENNSFPNIPPEINEPFLKAFIYQKSNNQFIDSVTFTFSSKSRVTYMQPACSRGEVVTDKLIYTAEIELPDSIYNHSQGYYISWERCCRNYIITNIFSTLDDLAGQTFYLEFPPVVKNGMPFINNSPRLFPPLNDYACVNRPYYVEFAGIDDDNDSLAYSLVTPLNTFPGIPYPPQPSPGPYDLIQWRPGFGLNNILNGSPDLQISSDGLLTATPTIPGLFVFSVKCDEFRAGIKIGEVRRDFQMLVIDCPEAVPPVIVGKKATELTFPNPNTNKLSVTFSSITPDQDRYIEVKVSDKDSFKGGFPHFFSENVRIKVIPLDFKRKDIDTWFPEITATLTNGADSIKVVKIFFPKCSYVNRPYQVGIVASDDACSLPLMDTFRVTVNAPILSPSNNRPNFITPKQVTAEINEGDKPLPWPFQVQDADLDHLEVAVVSEGFDLSNFGFAANFTEQKGLVNGQITWDPRCNIYDFTKRSDFIIKIIVAEAQCDLGLPDTAVYQLKIKLPGNADPIIGTDLTANQGERFVTVQSKLFEPLNFKVTGKDLVDNDALVLSVKGVDFNAADYSVVFPQVTGTGSVSSNFSWNPSCDKIDLTTKDTYQFQFIVVDNANKCRFYKADTVDVEVKLVPPNNATPLLAVLNSSFRAFADTELDYTLGQPIEFIVEGTDTYVSPIKDNLTLSLIDSSGTVEPQGYKFSKVIGTSPVQSVFQWNPDCSIFRNQIFKNSYQFKFKLEDDKCFNAKADTLQVTINVKDVDGSDNSFLLPNVFTPNGDNLNDYFALEGLEGGVNGMSYDEIVSLPKDNCRDQFQLIQITNRWGNIVFESTDRKFRWYANDIAAGVYYYRLKYTKREYKSPLSVRY